MIEIRYLRVNCDFSIWIGNNRGYFFYKNINLDKEERKCLKEEYCF